MTSATLPESPRALACAAPLRASADDADALGERIAALAARLHAATYQLLVLLAEFDAGEGWNNGFLSCAHWLHWRTGIDLGAAREKVRARGPCAGRHSGPCRAVRPRLAASG